MSACLSSRRGTLHNHKPNQMCLLFGDFKKVWICSVGFPNHEKQRYPRKEGYLAFRVGASSWNAVNFIQFKEGLPKDQEVESGCWLVFRRASNSIRIWKMGTLKMDGVMSNPSKPQKWHPQKDAHPRVRCPFTKDALRAHGACPLVVAHRTPKSLTPSPGCGLVLELAPTLPPLPPENSWGLLQSFFPHFRVDQTSSEHIALQSTYMELDWGVQYMFFL